MEGADELVALVGLEVGHLDLREAAHAERDAGARGSAVSRSLALGGVLKGGRCRWEKRGGGDVRALLVGERCVAVWL